MNGANKRSEAGRDFFCQAFLFKTKSLNTIMQLKIDDDLPEACSEIPWRLLYGLATFLYGFQRDTTPMERVIVMMMESMSVLLECRSPYLA